MTEPLADESTHRSLTYLAATTRGGIGLSSANLQEFVNSPQPTKARYVNPALNMFARSWINAVEASNFASFLESPAETMGSFLLRLGWAEGDEREMRLSPTGRAVLAQLDLPELVIDDESPLAVEIDPADPLAYARVFAVISSATAGMMVDPYLGATEFFDLLSTGSVSRVLTSDHDLNKKRSPIEHALAALPNAPAVRYLPLKQMHDRFFIPVRGTC